MSQKLTAKQAVYFSPKGRISVMEASRIAFSNMPHKFGGVDIHRQVARLTLRPSVYPDTVLRCLRELRQRGLIRFVCVNNRDSIYQKT